MVGDDDHDDRGGIDKGCDGSGALRKLRNFVNGVVGHDEEKACAESEDGAEDEAPVKNYFNEACKSDITGDKFAMTKKED